MHNQYSPPLRIEGKSETSFVAVVLVFCWRTDVLVETCLLFGDGS